MFSAVFAVTFALYGLPFKAVLYPAILCAVIGAVFIAVDYSRVLKRHRQLRRMRELAASLITSLPVPDGLIEEDYQAVIENLRSEVAGLEEAAAARYSEMTDYYTMWVHQIKTPISVSYTHLDVYKRQLRGRCKYIRSRCRAAGSERQ